VTSVVVLLVSSLLNNTTIHRKLGRDGLMTAGRFACRSDIFTSFFPPRVNDEVAPSVQTATATPQVFRRVGGVSYGDVFLLPILFQKLFSPNAPSRSQGSRVLRHTPSRYSILESISSVFLFFWRKVILRWRSDRTWHPPYRVALGDV